MSNTSGTAYAIANSLRAEYYANGSWRQDDLWTSVEMVAARDPAAVAFIEGENVVSFGELIESARRFGNAAMSRGLDAGDVVIIHGRHCIEVVIAMLGCAYARLVSALLPPMFSAEQIRAIIASTEARCVVGLGEPAELDRSCDAANAMGVKWLLLPDQFAVAKGGIAWSDFISGGKPSDPARVPVPADDLALLIYSSGTTGAPKGVMHSSNTARFAVERYCANHCIGPADTSLVVAAFGFVGSTILGICVSWFSGCRTVLLRNWSVEDAIDAISRYHISHFLLMPTHAIDILASPRLDRTDCSSVTRCVVAGLSEPQRIDAKTRLCAMPFPMYGMSESPAHVTGAMTDDWERLRTAEGRPLPGTEVLICDDADQPLPAAERGNILVRGPNCFLGYYRADDLNRSVLTATGYFRTGDIGFVDHDGYMSFVSRSRDIIRRGGVTITPGEIEAALRPHPRIADVAVIGLPDARLGERACVCVITRDGREMRLEELTDFLALHAFPRYMWPECVQMCESFPRTPSLKVQKNELKQQIVARGYP